MSKKKEKRTPEQIRYERNSAVFEEAVRLYQHRLGLMEWELFVIVDEMDDYRGTCSWQTTAKMAHITIDSEFLVDEGTTDDDLRKVAFHEICELLLGEFDDNLKRFYSEEFIEDMTHRVIRRLENFVFAS